jgi:hypothetical protein
MMSMIGPDYHIWLWLWRNGIGLGTTFDCGHGVPEEVVVLCVVVATVYQKR